MSAVAWRFDSKPIRKYRVPIYTHCFHTFCLSCYVADRDSSWNTFSPVSRSSYKFTNVLSRTPSALVHFLHLSLSSFIPLPLFTNFFNITKRQSTPIYCEEKITTRFRSRVSVQFSSPFHGDSEKNAIFFFFFFLFKIAFTRSMNTRRT